MAFPNPDAPRQREVCWLADTLHRFRMHGNCIVGQAAHEGELWQQMRMLVGELGVGGSRTAVEVRQNGVHLDCIGKVGSSWCMRALGIMLEGHQLVDSVELRAVTRCNSAWTSHTATARLHICCEAVRKAVAPKPNPAPAFGSLYISLRWPSLPRASRHGERAWKGESLACSRRGVRWRSDEPRQTSDVTCSARSCRQPRIAC